MAGRAGAKRGLSTQALKYFMDHPGEYVRVEDLAYALDEATEQQAAAAVVYNIREGKLPGLKAVQNGHVWVYEPEGGDDGSVHWELLRKGEDGTAVLQATDGTFWIAKQVGV